MSEHDHIGLSNYEKALARLREKLPAALKHPDVIPIAAARDEVLGHYGPVFRVDSPSKVNLDDFRAFLLFSNNRHWPLHRQSGSIFADPSTLREALYALADEGRPIQQRFDLAISTVRGMGRGIITAVLHVAFPEKYAVWNNTAEGALKQIGVWPAFGPGETNGSKYVKINDLIKRIAGDLDLDLWTLDAVWWALVQEDGKQIGSGEVVGQQREGDDMDVVPSVGGQAFGLERHLHDFLVDNWARTNLSSEWEIYSEDGDRLVGVEYPCAIGYIDILCKHKSQPRWLVIELKRGQTSDATVGQVLRYVGWVQQNLAAPGDSVEGLIIAHSSDQALEYALTPLPSVNLYLYEVEFRLVAKSLK